MSGIRSIGKSALVAILAVSLLAALAGCPRPARNGQVVLLLSAAYDGQKSAAVKANVAVGDIESLTVTVTKVVLQRDSAEDTEDAGAGSGHVTLFEGAADVNLVDLEGLNAALSSLPVPAGRYSKIRLEIQDPRLVLAADPETVITDVQLTANGRLFVGGTFDIVAGQDAILLLTFDSLHLVATGSGKYVLTPQLRAQVSTAQTGAVVTGTLGEVGEADLELILVDGTSVLTVDYAAAVVFRAEDVETPTGSALDLAPGLQVEITGTLYPDGTMVASSIRIVPN